MRTWCPNRWTMGPGGRRLYGIVKWHATYQASGQIYFQSLGGENHRHDRLHDYDHWFARGDCGNCE